MSNRSDIKIFIASSSELSDERKESIVVLTELNKRYPHLHFEPVLFEIDTPSGNFPWKERIQDGINPLLNEAHIVVVLFYSKAGEFTREELESALSQQKKVYLYLKEGFAPKGVEETKKYLELQELKENIDKESSLRYQLYKTVSEYYGILYRDLDKYIDETYPAPPDTPVATVSTSSQHIPIAPRPYLAHPYAIIKNFTGRREEMTRLTEWYKYEKEPMCIIEAIGGMGKSALCWKWLQDEIIVTNPNIKGIVWWSFYDQGFEEFIHHMYEYCIPENVRKQQQRIDETTELINALTNYRFLLVLDGFERVLRGYAKMMAMYIQEAGLSKKEVDDINEAFDIHQRTPITPKAEKLIRALCTGNSKSLMTTRLYPATIEGLAGIKHVRLTGLSKTDTIAFFQIEGIIGKDSEMIRAGEVYDFHPLMLKLLSTAIKRSFTRNINKALQKAFAEGLIDEKEPKEILVTSYNLLSPEERKVASVISVFRTAFTFDAAKALFPGMDGEKLEQAMMELYNLGFILYNEQQRLFDFHPILRSYLYDGLVGKDNVHQLAITYFTKLPKKEKVITAADLEPVVEQYHHLIRAGKYDEASRLYLDRLFEPLYYQLAQYDLCVDLSLQLFAKPSDNLPQLSTESYQRYILYGLSLSYANKGQLNKASECMLKGLPIDYKEKNYESLGIGLNNISSEVNLISGKLSNVAVHTTKSGALLKETQSSNEASSYILIGNILAAQALYSTTNGSLASEGYLDMAMARCMKQNATGLASWVALCYTKWVLFQIENKNTQYELQTEALNWGLKSMEYAEKFRISNYPVVIYFLFAYEALGRALINISSKNIIQPENGHIFFYDENFQNILDTQIPATNNYSALAERCVHEGLTLTRKINKVYDECTFSLLLLQIEWLKILEGQKEIEHFKEVEKLLIDTYALADRIGFRMLLADLHLFCVETLLDLAALKRLHKQKLLDLSPLEHIEKVRDFALDTSTLEDIFLPPDADEFYKDIREYAMLKRGLTNEERIKNGYYAAWLRAEKLKSRL